ncbi:MAG: type II secretion system GspH family protein [Alphaproteobacteria bacterium]|nr:type II secretion system GspH family protein [Alphaproteobacteria bacterium]MDY4690438.1 type II secretion system protein [Alphaproteobacteria bacterium]
MDVVRQYAVLLERRVQRGTQARKALVVTRQANPLGRSMIEMLGVLAIIGVLSVGGIAGYSKAMEQFKVDKAVSEYSYLIQGLLEHLKDLQNVSKPNEGDIQYGLTSVVEAESLVPETWEKISNHDYNDPYGNLIRIFSRSQTLVIDMYLGGFQSVDGGSASTAFSPKFCSSLMQNVVQPLASVLNEAWFTNGNDYYGDAYCNGNANCIRDISLSEINNVCNYCTKEANKLCGLILVF